MLATWFLVVRAETKLVENAYVTMTVWSIVRFWFFLLIFCDLLFLWDFFSDGEKDTKTKMVWKENSLSVFGSKCSFPIYAD